MAATIFSTLMDRHDQQASSAVRRHIKNKRCAPGINDIMWLCHDPQVEKQLGRSGRVVKQLRSLCKL